MNTTKGTAAVVFLLLSLMGAAQNLVPNPSFEVMGPCDQQVSPELNCSQYWADFLDLDPTNTPDLGYEGAVFFPPSTIDAFDGNQYLNIECSTGNPEYVQVQLVSPMAAGTTYCVSFYASVTQESPEVAPSLGAYFTNAPLLDSPFELGLQAHVQGPVDFDHTSWTLVSGTYTAAGGEDILVLSGFENTGTMPFPYMYIDMVSVAPMPPLALTGGEICNSTLLLDATAPGATYVWNNGTTSATMEASAAGTFTVTRTLGVCTQEATAIVTECPEDPTDSIPTDTVPDDSLDVPMAPVEYYFYVPNAFTPNNDGVNDVFGVVGSDTEQFELKIFNRWGEEVYTSNDIKEYWRGNHRGGAHYVPDGIYQWQMKATDGMNVFEETGHVMMMRE